MTRQEHNLRLFLRITAVVLFAALPAIVMPHPWMSAIHGMLGLGVLAEKPLTGYLTRSLSALYVLLGMLCWFVSCDVQRYRPLLRYCVPATFGFSITLVLIDMAVEMPVLWTLSEGISAFGWTLILWWLLTRISNSDRSNP